MNIDVDPLKLAKWLGVVKAQRTRSQKMMAEQYGPGSAAANEIAREILEIDAIVAACVQAQADTPMKAPKR